MKHTHRRYGHVRGHNPANRHGGRKARIVAPPAAHGTPTVRTATVKMHGMPDLLVTHDGGHIRAPKYTLVMDADTRLIVGFHMGT